MGEAHCRQQPVHVLTHPHYVFLKFYNRVYGTETHAHILIVFLHCLESKSLNNSKVNHFVQFSDNNFLFFFRCADWLTVPSFSSTFVNSFLSGLEILFTRYNQQGVVVYLDTPLIIIIIYICGRMHYKHPRRRCRVLKI